MLRPISRHTVHIELQNINKLIEITTHKPWAIKKGDIIVVSGEVDHESGKFIGYAYKNQNNGVVGYYKVSLLNAFLLIIGGFILIWAIFPVIHIISGLKLLILNDKCRKALNQVE